MEVKIQKPAYYFSWPDEEILDEKLLDISGDDETWLYTVDRDGCNGHLRTPTQQNHYHTPSGSVDSRTFTRRKYALRPSLESVVESPLSNRSSLGILSASRLNGTKLVEYSVTPSPTSQGRISSNFTGSDNAYIPRVFKLDTPLMNNPFERKRHDSELSDSSFIPSLDNQFDKNEAMTDSLVNFLERPNEKCQPPDGFQDEMPKSNSLVDLPEKESGLELREEPMTDSMVNFLDKVACEPPSGFGDEDMCNSIVNLDEKDILPNSDMTNSLMDYLESQKTKTIPSTRRMTLNDAENVPPMIINKETDLNHFNHMDMLIGGKSDHKFNTTFGIGRERNDTSDDSEKCPEVMFTNSVNISRANKKEIMDIKGDQSHCRMLNSTFEKDNLSVNRLRALNNNDFNITKEENDGNFKEFSVTRLKTPNKTNASSCVKGTFTTSNVDSCLRDTYSVPNGSFRMNGMFTKSINDTETNPKDGSRLNETFTKSTIDTKINSKDGSRLNETFTKSTIDTKINPKDGSRLNETFTKINPKDGSRLNETFPKSTIDTKINSKDGSQIVGTFTKNDFENASNLSKHIPQRNSTFNTTFTKLNFPSKDMSRQTVTRSSECLDAGVEDDRTSSASDSSFSSAASSNKPRSVDELRTIAQQQETDLRFKSSTPQEASSIGLVDLCEVEMSPIRRASLENRNAPGSRSAHSSPVRGPVPSPRPHPISRLQKPMQDARRQALQASSLSNLTNASGLRLPQRCPQASGLRLPQPASSSQVRPSTAPAPAATGIPRPQSSRLPMPRARASGIPTVKRGGRR